ncbi:PilZ domain-containing protein [Caproiciproducens sp. NJN-50]|uniref:PilZ domain-containing protein n=1 Tax=Acutalibacteraceae TaxID=3082771 RepID=UPI000FFE1F42|nr:MULTISPECIES: PilZ domain-containing protein [Acutalibacteraceae]QAT50665.1 PilZ domain-containing protein [Caproiciproducens sp. NJN-50]
MLPIPEDYLRSPCEVKAMDNKPILTGYLGWIGEDGIQIVNKAEPLPIVHCNTTVRISVFSTALGFRVLVGKVYLSSPEFIRISDVQSLADYEKRNFFRVRVDIETEAFPENEEGEIRKGSEAIAVSIKDLSLSGLYFFSSRKLEVGDRLSVRLSLYDSAVFLSCRVVRRLLLERAQEDGYGCEFLNNSGPKGDLLCKYLFDCQREQIRTMKERQL